jgi:pimeloyl-ACP methyl ester carboxylesterase
MEPQIGFCTTPDGARIAYITLGQGPAYVFPPAYFASVAINASRAIPEFAHGFDRIARYHTVVIYDIRGAGLSDRNRTVFTLESEVQDLETVINHLKLDKVMLCGMSMSGPIAIAYAAKHPERVTHLVLYGSYAYYGKYVSEELKASILSLLRQPDNWLGGRALQNLVIPQAQIGTVEMFEAMLKDIATPEVAANLMNMFYKLDVTHLCPRIKTPTLVMHRKGDTLVEFKAGLEMASLIPNARFVALEGNIHFALWGDFESVLRNGEDFLGDPVIADKATKAARPITKKPGYDVFISFAFPDKQAAGKIYAYLKSNGINPFWCEELSAGQDYPELLGEAIRNSKSFLLVVSDSTDNSDSVRKETTIAHNNKKPIIPVRIKEILPKKLEYLIASSLFFDAFPQPLAQHLPKIASDIKKIVGSKAEKKTELKK